MESRCTLGKLCQQWPNSLRRGISPTSNNKEEPCTIPTMLSLADTHEQVALEAHIHPRSSVSGGIRHACQ